MEFLLRESNGFRGGLHLLIDQIADLLRPHVGHFRAQLLRQSAHGVELRQKAGGQADDRHGVPAPVCQMFQESDSFFRRQLTAGEELYTRHKKKQKKVAFHPRSEFSRYNIILLSFPISVTCHKISAFLNYRNKMQTMALTTALLFSHHPLAPSWTPNSRWPCLATRFRTAVRWSHWSYTPRGRELQEERGRIERGTEWEGNSHYFIALGKRKAEMQKSKKRREKGEEYVGKETSSCCFFLTKAIIDCRWNQLLSKVVPRCPELKHELVGTLKTDETRAGKKLLYGISLSRKFDQISFWRDKLEARGPSSPRSNSFWGL